MKQMNKPKYGSPEDHRKYVRLRSSFPVDFAIVRLQGDLPGLDWQQATTQNISDEGICIETVNLTEPTIKYFREQNVLLEVRLKVPPDKPYIKAVCEVMWYKSDGNDRQLKFTVGCRFKSIHRQELERVLWHARLFRFYSRLGFALSIAVFLAILILGIKHHFSR